METTILQRRYLLAGIAAASLLGPLRSLRAQTAPPPFSPEQLDQMLAPIALYPDPLLSQVLMAATYPLEVVEAARWSRANPGLRGNDAVNAVASQDWDVSVKSLVAFPQVLSQMDQHLDWTQNLGDAQLAQPGDVSDSIQRLRARAADAGRLTNVPNETVQYLGTGPDRYVVIEPVDPNVIYVPYYNPVWAYGVWPYAAYPPFYYPPLAIYGYGAVLATGFMFGIGIAASIALFGGWHWGRGDWGRGAGYININVNRVVNIDRHYDVARINNNRGAWQHDPEHRRGVAYRDVATRERFQPQPGATQRQQYRGRVEGTPASGQRPQTAARIETPRGPQGTTVGPQTQRQPQVNAAVPRPAPATSTPRPQFQPQVTPRPGGTPPAPRGPAINGVERGAQINRESQRGNQQIQSMVQHAPPPPRPSSPPPQPPKGGKR